MQIEKAEIAIHSSALTTYVPRARTRQELDNLEERLSEHENRLLQMNLSYETMQRHYLELTELKHVLRETAVFFEASEQKQCLHFARVNSPTCPLKKKRRGGGGGRKVRFDLTAS